MNKFIWNSEIKEYEFVSVSNNELTYEHHYQSIPTQVELESQKELESEQNIIETSEKK
jgi:hypothetical protein